MDPEQREAAESEQEFDNLMESDEINPYDYGDRETTFGLVRKKIYYPKLDFGLQLREFVSAGSFTGYFCTVTHEMDRRSRFVSVHFVCYTN